MKCPPMVLYTVSAMKCEQEHKADAHWRHCLQYPVEYELKTHIHLYGNKYFSVDGFVKNRERIRFTLKVGINDFVFLQ